VIDHKRYQIGAGKIGTIIGLIVVVAAIVFAVKMIPARVKVYELKDYSEVQARQRALGTNIRSDEQLHQLILKKAQELELPVKDDDITVRELSGSFKVNLKYTYPINFIVLTHEWKIDQEVEAVKISM
jgi:hypothetical protein